MNPLPLAGSRQGRAVLRGAGGAWGLLVVAAAAVLFGGLFAAVALGLHPLAAIAIPFAVAVGLVVLARPELGLYLTALTLPLEKFGRFTEGTAVAIVSVAKLAGVLTLIAWSIRVLTDRRRVRAPAPFWLLVGFWIVAATTLAHTTAPDTGLARLLSFLSTIAFFLVIVNLVDRPEVARRTIECLLVATLAMGLFAIAQRYLPQYTVTISGDMSYDAAGVVIDESETTTLGTPVARSGGAAGSPHVYALNLLVALPLYIALLATAKGNLSRLWLGLGTATALLNLLLTQTRAALLVLAISLLLLIAGRVIVINLRTLGAALLAGLVALPFLPATFYQRLLSVESYTREGSATLETRFDYWASGLVMLRENWLFGMGIGNFVELPKYNAIATPGFGLMHNIYLQMLNEVGIFGFALLLLFLWFTWRSFHRAERELRSSGREGDALLARAMGVSFVSVLVLGFTIDFLHFAVKDWWLVAGLGVAVAGLRPSSPASGASR